MNPAGLVGVDLPFRRGTRDVLERASLTVALGYVVALLGVNGSGKTTLLRLLMGFMAPAHGKVFLDGADLVLDEPMSGLDYGAQIRLIALLRKLAGEGQGVDLAMQAPAAV